MSLSNITINGAKKAAQRHGLSDGVVVLAFHRGAFKAVSYGTTKAKCRDLGRLIDFVADSISSGAISLPSMGDDDIGPGFLQD